MFVSQLNTSWITYSLGIIMDKAVILSMGIYGLSQKYTLKMAIFVMYTAQNIDK